MKSDEMLATLNKYVSDHPELELLSWVRNPKTGYPCLSYPNGSDEPANPFNPGEHTHLGILQPGAAATENSAGYKDCYECSCGKFFEDEACTVEITDLDVWKAQGGNGYIAPLSGEKDVPASPQTGDASGIPQTGDASNMALWVVLMLASAMGLCACLISGKRKRERE